METIKEIFGIIGDVCEGNCVILGQDAAPDNTLTDVSQCFYISTIPDTILELKGNEEDYNLEKFTIGLVESSEFIVDQARENCNVFIKDNDCEVALLMHNTENDILQMCM